MPSKPLTGETAKMAIFNLLVVGFVVWVFAKAIGAGMKRDSTDRYFQTVKIKTGKKFHNFFGVPNANFK
ncbi:MAG: hypothetical protein HQL97_05800 [Magnetococcales bacterium]|nr:hypothetical protein [Magnetococcales bacterium]MBF0261340.1 hypothetical protein [Magnetococcales bacterium]